MRANNALALVFTNSNDHMLEELTGVRSMASVPFGSRYRIIDFHLSNLVNAGISKIGIVPRANYRSLMDHIGSGRPWDLDRKMGGISFLPPFIDGNAGMYKGHIDAIHNLRSYISKGQHEYVVLCDANTILNIDLKAMFKQHKLTGADITVAYKNGPLPAYESGHTLYGFDEKGKINEVRISEEAGKVCNYGISIGIFRRDLLLSMATSAFELGVHSINRAIQMGLHKTAEIYGYKVENFVATVDGLKSYTEANMALLNSDIRKDLFNSQRPIYTKTRDDMPTRYGLESQVKNSLIGEGCIIEGKVTNCVLFRGVKVGKGSVLKDCIIMQDTVIGDDCQLNFVTADKDVTLQNGIKLRGAKESHYIIKKGTTI